MSTRAIRFLAALLALSLVAAACGGDDDDSGGAAGDDGAAAGVLTGLFRVDEGTCGDGAVESGSSFRMVQPGGTTAEGPFVPNADSPCGDKTWTPLSPGSDGGLVTGDYQPQPDPPFSDSGAGTAARIVQPQRWFAVEFALATNETDPQTGTDVDAPRVEVAEDGTIAADLRALGVAWNGQHFNQGTPKPDGSLPGATTPVTGTYDESTGRYVLEWTSQIVGGPFNNFVGLWHLEGTFEPA